MAAALTGPPGRGRITPYVHDESREGHDDGGDGHVSRMGLPAPGGKGGRLCICS